MTAFSDEELARLAKNPQHDISDLARELLEARKDARRYRWLRERHWNDSGLFVIAGSKTAVRLGTDCPSLDRLDAAIDAALAEGK